MNNTSYGSEVLQHHSEQIRIDGNDGGRIEGFGLKPKHDILSENEWTSSSEPVSPKKVDKDGFRIKHFATEEAFEEWEKEQVQLLKKTLKKIEKRKQGEIAMIEQWKEGEIRKLKNLHPVGDDSKMSTAKDTMASLRTENAKLQEEIESLERERKEWLANHKNKQKSSKKVANPQDEDLFNEVKEKLVKETKLQHSKEAIKAELKRAARFYRVLFENCEKESNAKNILAKYMRKIVHLVEEKCRDKKLAHKIRSKANARRIRSFRKSMVVLKPDDDNVRRSRSVPSGLGSSGRSSKSSRSNNNKKQGKKPRRKSEGDKTSSVGVLDKQSSVGFIWKKYKEKKK